MKRILIFLITAWVFGSPMLQVMAVNGSALDVQIDEIEGADPESSSTQGSTLSYVDAMLMKDGRFTHIIKIKKEGVGQYYSREFEVEYFTPIRFFPIAFIFNKTTYRLRGKIETTTWP